MRALILGAVCVLLLLGCEEKVIGCLDFRALQVDISADEECDDCCVFPELDLQILYASLGDTAVQLLGARPSIAIGQDTFGVLGVGFYLSELALERSDGSLYALEDTLSYVLNDEADLLRRDISLVRIAPTSNSSVAYGSLLEEQTVVALRASVGVPTALESLQPLRQYRNSPLAPRSDSLLARVSDNVIEASTWRYRLNGDTLRRRVLASGTSSVPVRIALPEAVVLPTSFNLKLTIGIPLEDLMLLEPGEVAMEEFVIAVFDQATVLAVEVSRR